MHFNIQDLRISCDGHEIEELIADKDGYYHASFEFDDAWAGLTKTARFMYGHNECDSLIESDNTCLIPIDAIHHLATVNVLVFAGEYGTSLVTNSACLKVVKSTVTVSNYDLADDSPNIYTQVAALAADALKVAKSVEDRANNGEFNGRDGADIIGDDWATKKFVEETLIKTVGDINAVLATLVSVE